MADDRSPSREDLEEEMEDVEEEVEEVEENEEEEDEEAEEEVEEEDEEESDNRTSASGNGTRLADIPFIEDSLRRGSPTDKVVQNLHKSIFGTVGDISKVKPRLSNFNGMVYEEEGDEEKFSRRLLAFSAAELGAMAQFLGLVKGGTKPAVVERIKEYLETPEDKGKKVPTAKAIGTKRAAPAKPRAAAPVKRARGSAKAKKDPEAPKRPMTAFFYYAASVRDQVRADNPDLKMTEISGVIGQQWRELDASGRERFEEQHRADKERYEEDLREYRESGKEAEWQEKMAEAGEEEPKARRGKKAAKDPNAPKRPLTAYFLFSNAIRPEVKAENPDAKLTEMATLISRRWAELTEEEKAPYQEQHRENKVRYEREKEEYEKSGRADEWKAKQAEADVRETKPRSRNSTTKAAAGGKTPTKAQLKTQIKKLVKRDVSVSLKDVRKNLERIFGCNLRDKRDLLKTLVKEVL